MQAFITHTGLVAPLNRVNVDTDQIIPKQFLKRIERTGFGQFLFYDWRFREDGSPDPSFELNRPEYRSASILLAGANFGCGSSREHAPWALADFGFRVILASSFADIFFNNCFKNGMLPIRLPDDEIARLFKLIEEGTHLTLTVDLDAQLITGNAGLLIRFEVDPFRKECLLSGLDDIGLTLEHEADITAFEQRRLSLA